MAAPIQRAFPLTVRQVQYLWQLVHGTGNPETNTKATAILPQEIITTWDTLRVFRSNMHMGGWAWHGEVATEAAMLALWSTSSRSCWPNDKCIRTDLGCLMTCTSGNGKAANDWVSVPLLSKYQSAIDSLVSLSDSLGTSLSDLAEVVSGKWNTPDNAEDLEKIGHDGDGKPTWNGVAWPSDGGAFELNSDTLIESSAPNAWFKYDSGVEEADGDPAEINDTVKNWIDQSGNGNHFTQDTVGYRPTLTADGVVFDGTDDHLWCTGFPSIDLANCTAIWVASSTSNSGYRRLLAIGASGVGTSDYNSANALVISAGPPGGCWDVEGGTGAEFQTLLSDGAPAPMRVYSMRICNRVGIIGHSDLVSGTGDTSTSLTTSRTAMVLGAHWLNGSLNLNYCHTGTIKELVLWPRALGNVEMGMIVAALRTKHGV